MSHLLTRLLGHTLILATCLLAHLDAQTSPEVLENGQVTFRCKAIHAESVSAHGQFGEPVDLHKGDDGLWTGSTSAPVNPGIYEYRFKIDGRNSIDSRNPSVKPQRWPNTSILHIPSTPPSHWDTQDIPHGTLHRHIYRSTVLNKWRELVIYTPPGQQDTILPVLYLAHGYSDNQRTWTEHGKAHSILDSLIHQKIAKPMIVVMPDAHAIDPHDKKFDDYAPKNTAAFCRELLEDIIPLVESKYPTAGIPKSRAFAGLSMGGHHALTIALSHSEHFSHIGAFSPAPPKISNLAPADVKRINQNLKQLWIACGDKDFLFERNQNFHAKLLKMRIKVDYKITPRADHSWPVWRDYLIDYTPELFR